MSAEQVALNAVLQNSHEQEEEIRRLREECRNLEQHLKELSDQLRAVRRAVDGDTQPKDAYPQGRPMCNEINESQRPRCPTCGR